MLMLGLRLSAIVLATPASLLVTVSPSSGGPQPTSQQAPVHQWHGLFRLDARPSSKSRHDFDSGGCFGSSKTL